MTWPRRARPPARQAGRTCSPRSSAAAGARRRRHGQLPHPVRDHGGGRHDVLLASVSPDERPPDSGSAREGVGPNSRSTSRPAACPRGWPPRPCADPGPHSAGPDGGRLAIVAPDALIPALSAAVPEAIPGDQPESLDAAAALLTVSQAKGLEFDRVVVADPAGILTQSENGGHDLYVAITRATHRLTVVYDGDLPPSLRSLRLRFAL